MSLFLLQTDTPVDDTAAIGALMAFGAIGVCFMAVIFIMTIATIAGMWKMFDKAGRPGWAAVVPFYSDMIRNEISGTPVVWTYYSWIILALNMFTGGLAGFAPLLLLVIYFFTYSPLLKAFGRDNGTGSRLFALFFPYIVFPQIGFGANTYLGPQADAVAALPNLPWIDNTATTSSAAPSVGTPINTNPPVSSIPAMTESSNQAPTDSTPPASIPSMKGYADDDLNKPQ
jgi:hypothetical protein